MNLHYLQFFVKSLVKTKQLMFISLLDMLLKNMVNIK